MIQINVWYEDRAGQHREVFDDAAQAVALVLDIAPAGTDFSVTFRNEESGAAYAAAWKAAHS